MRGNGATLTLVRQAKGGGWTQAKLAQEADVSQGRISKVESGLLELEGDALAAVAAALEVPIDLLAVHEPTFAGGVSCVHHRRRKSKLTATSARRIEGLTQLVSMSTTRLLQEHPQPITLDLPEFPVESYDPAEAARRVRAQASIARNEPIPDVVQFVESLGIVVVRRDFGTDAQDGVSLRLPDRRPIIVVNTALPGDRLRLSVAHELGHLTLHGWQVATGEQDVEDEAFHFARELIAPEAVVRPNLTHLTARDFRRLLDLKLEWGMSISAFIEMAKHTAAIDAEVHRTLRMRLNTLGWRTVEPGVVPDEHPHLINQVVDTQLDDLHRPVGKVASVALMLPAPFKQHYMAHRTDAAGLGADA